MPDGIEEREDRKEREEKQKREDLADRVEWDEEEWEPERVDS